MYDQEFIDMHIQLRHLDEKLDAAAKRQSDAIDVLLETMEGYLKFMSGQISELTND